MFAALKSAFVFLAGDKLTSYSSEYYQKITVSSSDTTQVFQANWKVKSSSSLDLPEIECLRTTVEHVDEVATSSSKTVCNVSSNTVSISSELDSLHLSQTSQQDPGDTDSVIGQLEVILGKEWGYTELRTE